MTANDIQPSVIAPESVDDHVAGHLFHDFKGYLATAMMNLESLRDGLFGELNADQDRCLRRVVLDCERAAMLIDDYRDALLMLDGTYPRGFETIDLGECFEALLTVARLEAEERCVSLLVEVPEDLPRVRARGALLPRLLARAWRATLTCVKRGGAIEVHASIVPAPAGGWISVEFLAPTAEWTREQLETVFDRRAQAGAGVQIGRGYTMFFCRTAARHAGGDVTLRPWPGRGTIVRIEVPFEA